MRFFFLFGGLLLVFPVQSYAQEESCSVYDDFGNCVDESAAAGCSAYDENGECADAMVPPDEGGNGSGEQNPNGGGGIVITENTPVIGPMALQCFKLLSSQSALVQWACEQAADRAYQECLDSYDGIDPTGPDGRHVCGAPHNSALENCAAVPEVLADLVTACSDEDSTILQLYPF